MGGKRPIGNGEGALIIQGRRKALDFDRPEPGLCTDWVEGIPLLHRVSKKGGWMETESAAVAQAAQARILSLEKWLVRQPRVPGLCIPDYQRPYSWGETQVRQLLRDIEHYARTTGHAGDASTYRMGTVVVHADAGLRNIVDGQQRTVTLLLVLHALRAVAGQAMENAAPGLAMPWGDGPELVDLALPHALSHARAQQNYPLILRHVKQAAWGKAEWDFLLYRCEVVCVTLHDLTEAFQFFDAQNSRGKALCVHDLLKAYHLRAFAAHQSNQRKAAVQAWEQCSSEQLERLFSTFLYVVRQYGRSKAAEHFGMQSVVLFKGLNLAQSPPMPLARPWQMLDQGLAALSPAGNASWPCQLDAPIVNGLRFFQWVQHYLALGFHLPQEAGNLPPWVTRVWSGEQELPPVAQKILTRLGQYKGRHRVGDTRIRDVFDALLLYYVDKFGCHGLGQAVQVAFVWAYARLMQGRVRAGSVDKLLRETPVNPFALLRDAMDPQDFLRMPLNAAFFATEKPLSGLDGEKGLKPLFVEIGYWRDK